MAKKFNIVSRGDNSSEELALLISNKLKSAGWIKANVPDIVLSIGGDGTMLEAFHMYVDCIDEVAFIGLHTGHLGFYTDWKQSEVGELLNCLINKQPKIVEYPLVELTFDDGEEELKYLALNEIYLKSPKKSLICTVYINGEHFENFRGDGLCISTPSGSTAYNKALNGSIVHPALETIQLSEMASVNNNVYRTIGSSIVLPKHHVLEIIVDEFSEDLVLGSDNLTIMDQFTRLKLKVSDKKIKFARYKGSTFWNRVKESFI